MMEVCCYPDTMEDVYTKTHESGLKIIVAPKKHFAGSYAILGTRFGSVVNRFKAAGDKEETCLPDGIAHYLEHKMFDQENGEIVFDRFSEHGADANAFTGFTQTAYLFRTTSDFYECLDILLDYTMHPYFTNETVEKERGIIGQEIRMYNDDPDWNVYFNALRAMYSVNTVNIDIAGTDESIAKITPELLYKCYNTFYAPENMVLAVAGNVDPDEVYKFVSDRLPKKRENAKAELFFETEPLEVAKEKIKVEFDIGTPQFVIGFKQEGFDKAAGADKRTEEEAMLHVLAKVLFGKGSRLYNELYDDGLINDSFSYSVSRTEAYGFTTVSGESENPDEVFRRVKEFVDEKRRTGITEAEFLLAQKACRGRALQLYDSIAEYANELLSFSLENADYASYATNVLSLEPDGANDVLLSSFDPARAVLSAVYPKGGLKE